MYSTQENRGILVNRQDPLRNCHSLLDLWKYHATATPDRCCLVYKDMPYTFRELWQNILKAGAYYASKNLQKGDRVILKLDNSPYFFYAFYGAMVRGLIPVPLFHQSDIKRAEKIRALSGAVLVVDEDGTYGDNVHDLSNFEALPETAPYSSGEDLAFLQYTSGTTGEAKGVMLTHHNLLANVRQMYPSGTLTKDDVFVSWLPVYHDMGLIAMTMIPLYLGAKMVLLPISPMPAAWLGAIEKYKGTFTASPDFGYRFATKFSKPNAYDISSLRFGLIAAEPVRINTVHNFENKFNVKGVLKPSYGLAEASVGLTFWNQYRNDIKHDDKGYVAVGRAFAQVDFKILDTGNKELPVNEPGEILFKSPSGTQGYFRNEAATEALFFNGYIRTGDIGYIDEEGHLYVVGRKKQLIIKGGRNICPREVEEIVDEVLSIRQCAAIGLESTRLDGEDIHVFIELEKKKEEDQAYLENLKTISNKAVLAQLGVRIDRFHFVPSRFIPKTFNGKIQYGKLKELAANPVLA